MTDGSPGVVRLAMGSFSDPTALALSDPVLLVSVAGWLATLALVLYR